MDFDFGAPGASISGNSALMWITRFSSFLRLGVMSFFIATLPLYAADEPKVGALDAEGHLILHFLQSEDHQRLTMTLRDPYGYMIFNDGTEEKPVMRIVIALKKDNRLIECRTWPELEKALALIPAGSKIHRYDRCLCPLSFGLKDNFWESFQKALKKRKLTKSEDEVRITCTCGKY